MVADELRQVAHTVGLHQAHAGMPDIFNPQDIWGEIEVVPAQKIHVEQARCRERPQTGKHLFLLEVLAIHHDAPFRLVPQHRLSMWMQTLFLQLILATEGQHLRLGFDDFTTCHLQALRSVAVVAIEESQIGTNHKLHAVVAW